MSAKKTPRPIRSAKKIIYIFCEGESEQEYANFLKEEFSDVAAIQPPVIGLFEQAKRNFSREVRYKNKIEVIDEIWFFFDTEEDTGTSWDTTAAIIKWLKKLKKKPPIKIRLLMNKSCIEYWFLLHFKKTTIPIRSAQDKLLVEDQLKQKNFAPSYKKGDHDSIFEIAQRYQIAKENGSWALSQIKDSGLPPKDNESIRNEWLYKTTNTFTNVHEAIDFLEQLRIDK